MSGSRNRNGSRSSAVRFSQRVAPFRGVDPLARAAEHHEPGRADIRQVAVSRTDDGLSPARPSGSRSAGRQCTALSSGSRPAASRRDRQGLGAGVCRLSRARRGVRDPADGTRRSSSCSMNSTEHVTLGASLRSRCVLEPTRLSTSGRADRLRRTTDRSECPSKGASSRPRPIKCHQCRGRRR